VGALATDPVPAPIRHLLPESGTRLGPYELIRELGRGGMGVVYLARDTRLGRRVAIKMLLDASREVADRFLAEARATAKCEHDHIVIIHDVDEHAGNPYMVLELLEGRTLRDVLRGPISPGRAIEIMLPIARALACAHGSHILHRDLKPENVFVTASGKIKVLDFGIAVALADATTPADTVGTPQYMAPEQLRGEPLDHRCDLWAAGMMMFEMLAGRLPIAPPTRERMLAEAASAAAMPSLASAAPGVSDELVAIVDGCLRKPPGDRLADANELARRLATLVPSRRVASVENPYLGLRAFEEGDADRFFGRERDLERVLARIRE
jgi:serine/threonine protein kinase